MLDTDTRNAILKLLALGHGSRAVAKTLNVSRNAVKRVLSSGTVEVPTLERGSKADEHLDLIGELYQKCRGNKVRVHEKLLDHGIEMSYQTLTKFCRKHGIGAKKKKRAGRYHFSPSQEMQHDTSPHIVEVGGKKRKLQCASIILCFSRMMYVQVYPRFTRLFCKVFLTEALQYFGGSCDCCMVDNTNLVVVYGTGKNAVMVPEMEVFAARFDFHFKAHEKGDANRSARVERPFDFIENNFYPGRTFSDLDDLNRQLLQWCEEKNRWYRDKLRARPIDLYQEERMQLKQLPIYIPEVYDLQQRIVDCEGYVNLYRNCYSVPEEMIGRSVEVRASKDRVRIFYKHRLLVDHHRREDGGRHRVTVREHFTSSRDQRRAQTAPPFPEEGLLAKAAPPLAELIDRLKKKHKGRAAAAVKRLYRLYLDYPTDTLVISVQKALDYGLYDLERIERMVLRAIAGDYYRLHVGKTDRTEREDYYE